MRSQQQPRLDLEAAPRGSFLAAFMTASFASFSVVTPVRAPVACSRTSASRDRSNGASETTTSFSNA